MHSKANLAKTSKAGAEPVPDVKQDSTSYSASIQSSITWKKKQAKTVKNKCSMHLGVNLRQAQVKAAAGIGVMSDSDARLESEGEKYVEDVFLALKITLKEITIATKEVKAPHEGSKGGQHYRM